MHISKHDVYVHLFTPAKKMLLEKFELPVLVFLLKKLEAGVHRIPRALAHTFVQKKKKSGI